MKTLCFDIENVFVRKINLKDFEELLQLKVCTNLDTYIVVSKEEKKGCEQNSDEHVNNMKQLKANQEKLTELIENYEYENEFGILEECKEGCCNIGNRGKMCLCNKDLYQIRPYVFMMLRAIQPFFELVALANIPNPQLEQIIDHIENMLNKPIYELIKRQK